MNWLTRWRTSSGAADAKLVLVGHSMGGLISRYFLECLGGWQHTRTLITLGTPHRGSVNAVDSIVNGVKKGIGPLGLDLTPLLRSYPSVYQLLPTYPCVDTGTGGLQRIATAAESGALPVVRAEWAREARAFHTEIEDAQKRNAATDAYRDQGYRLIPVVGIEQPPISRRPRRVVRSSCCAATKARTWAAMERCRGFRRRRSSSPMPCARSTPPRRMARCRTLMVRCRM